MNEIEQLVRQNIRNLEPYSSAREEFYDEAGILLDANENPYGQYNRYPDPQQRILKQAVARLKNLNPENIFLGNGSDEAIDLAVRIFCEPRKHKILSFPPTFGVVRVVASINDVIPVTLPLKEDFQIDMEQLPSFMDDEEIRILYLCTPNNPTANLLHEKDIEWILEQFKGIVLLDEAYMDFAQKPSYISLISKYPRLVVLQTMSKAWGLAGARIGIVIAHPAIIRHFNNVKMPYNISDLNQEMALKKLADKTTFEKNLRIVLEEKEKLSAGLQECAVVKKIYPSDTNFFLVEVNDSATVYTRLTENGIIVRNQNRAVKNCLRISVGTPEENTALITALKKMNT